MISFPSGSWRLQAVRVVSLVIIGIGAAGWLERFLFDGTSVELPNTEVVDVAIFRNGLIATADPFIQRIQLFDAKGRFLRALVPTANGGYFCLDVVGDQLLSYSARGNLLEHYNDRGDLISKGTYSNDSSTIDCNVGPNVSSIHAGYGGASILLKDGRLVRLENKWWHYVLPGSFYSLILFAIGLILNPDWRRGIFGLWRRRSKTGGATTSGAKP